MAKRTPVKKRSPVRSTCNQKDQAVFVVFWLVIVYDVAMSGIQPSMPDWILQKP